MRKPPSAGNAALKRIWFSGAPQSGVLKAPTSTDTGGPAPLSRSLPLSHPDFGGCRWPIESDSAEQLFCCAPAKGPFCAPHSKRGVIPTPSTGRGSFAEFMRGLERFL